ncbi:ubiquitin-like-specific protease ESD4 isoform X1 [Sorghum bicolor]|uniref:ubiquitin-like-specific protease ESD4 isoform X1 n=1 Tax=Sorghum bicolor TaxID=4558 RepID=UPI000B424FC7|nr:ubiquitin-like-specific protease ESD4 isoform X1 [Sorghum bicolor]|eukprot:XP_021316807.1 ubiquitin-like-specific protease ESD4 isoform X1 [Sorghum bicolor]
MLVHVLPRVVERQVKSCYICTLFAGDKGSQKSLQYMELYYGPWRREVGKGSEEKEECTWSSLLGTNSRAPILAAASCLAASSRCVLSRCETIVQIGRYHVDATLFGDSFRRRHRVGTFVMNVFCEALNTDYKANPDLKPSKCFLTSDVVDKLCTQTFEVSAYNSYLSSRVIGFSINKFNMVMIPVCKFEHWWLIVANIRDNRFDILNSLEMDGTTSKMTNEICDNFRKLYRHNFGKVFDKLSLPIQVQPAPQQKTGFDCGIYVMKFMELWDGRKLHLHDLSMEDTNTYRQKIANYILRHPKNLKTTAAVKKFISSDT